MIGFPWLIYLRFFLAQVLAFNLLALVLLAVYVEATDIGFAELMPWALAFFLGSAVVSAVSSYRFTRPLRRALSKALRVSSKRLARHIGIPDHDLLDEEPGEYAELELALDRIEKKLKKRKEQLQREREENAAFMSSVQEGLISISPEQKLLYFNSQFAAQFLDPEQLKRGPITLTNALRVPEVLEAFRRVLDEGATQKITVRLLTRLDNLPRYFSVSLTPLRKDKSREIYGVIGIFYDITDIKRAEQIRIEFVGNASHELRTPLTSVKGYVDTLKEDVRLGRTDQAGDFLEIISRNVDRLNELVNDLLTLSSLEHNSAELRLETVNPLAISDQVVKDLAVMAAEKNQVIRVTGEVPPFIADPGKVEQVLRNLVSNAIKYIPTGGGVHIRWESGPRQEILLRVIDNGPGIPEEHHARLFERFYRVDKGRARDAGGTGLGLAIVKHIMQSHGGAVSMKSQSGQGSEFVCTFPRLKEGPFANV